MFVDSRCSLVSFHDDDDDDDDDDHDDQREDPFEEVNRCDRFDDSSL